MSRIGSKGMLAFEWVNCHPISNGYSNEKLLDFSLAGGVKVAATDRIGFRFQVRLLMPILVEGEYFTSHSVEHLLFTNTTTVAFQGDITVAVILVIGSKHK